MYPRLGADGGVGETPGGGDAGLNRVRYWNRLLPHFSDTPLTFPKTAHHGSPKCRNCGE